MILWYVLRTRGAEAANAALSMVEDKIDEKYRIAEWQAERAQFDYFKQDIRDVAMMSQ